MEKGDRGQEQWTYSKSYGWWNWRPDFLTPRQVLWFLPDWFLRFSLWLIWTLFLTSSFKLYLLSNLRTRFIHMFAHASVHISVFSFVFTSPSDLEIMSSLVCPQTVFTSRTKWEMEEDAGAKGIILVWGKKLRKFPSMLCLGHWKAGPISASLWRYRWTLHNLKIIRRGRTWFQIMPFITEGVFIARKLKDFYMEKNSPVLGTWFTWDSYTVTPAQSLRKTNTGFFLSCWWFSSYSYGVIRDDSFCCCCFFYDSFMDWGVLWTCCSFCSDDISKTPLSFEQSVPWHISPSWSMCRIRHGLDSLPVSILSKYAVSTVCLDGEKSWVALSERL